jgi:hypothetical protein
MEASLLHYMDKLVYPDVSATALTVGGVIVCAFKLALYGSQAWRIRNNELKQSLPFQNRRRTAAL